MLRPSLGDLTGYAPFVNEVADFLVENGIEGVQGNYDEPRHETPVEAVQRRATLAMASKA